jgi:peptidyl-tRNA hydrolase, PTH1 family
VVCGLGNPGGEYANTRHNVGWWFIEEMVRAWGFPPLERKGPLRVSAATLDDTPVALIQPLTYMNRSGVALAAVHRALPFEPATDLLVVVDDAALDVGRVRMRAQGSSGGHNGLRSVEATLRTQQYTRLRIGVGASPPGVELADWVLSPFEPEDEQRIRTLLPELVDCVRVWVHEGVEAATGRCNR